MSLLNLHWPEWIRLYWLLCAPLAVFLIWALYRVHKTQHDWRTLLPQAFHHVLLNIDAPRQRYTRLIILAGAWLCALLALAGPSWHSTFESPAPQAQALPMVVVIQLTPDLLANDLPPSRLHQVRAKVLRILEQRDTAFTAIVVYAGSAHTLLPLSNDLLTSSNLLQALQPDLMPVPGQRADLAVARAIDLLQQGAQGSGEIILITSGVSVSEQNAITQQLKHHPIQLKILGVGTLTGVPISATDQDHFLTDATGAVIISRLNQTSLQLLGKDTHAPYQQMSTDESDLAALHIITHTDTNLSPTLSQPHASQEDQGYWLLLPILLLTAVLARRGSLLLILICCLPVQSFALEFADLWQRPDQQGAQLIEHSPSKAAERFRDPLWRATALYYAQDYHGAAQLFAEFDSAQAHYNRGNALALADQPAQAVLAYTQALNLAPEMLAAQYNLAVVQAYLDTLEAQQPDTSTRATAQDSEAASSALNSVTTATDHQGTAQAATSDQASAEATQITPESSHTQSPVTHSNLASTPATAPAQPEDSQPQIHLESWLEQIPDNPSELLKRKFLYEQNMQETAQ